MLLIVGVYVALYGIWSYQIFSTPAGEHLNLTPWIDSIITTAEGVQTDASNWFAADVSIGSSTMARTTILGWAFFILNAGLIIAGAVARRAKSVTPQIG